MSGSAGPRLRSQGIFGKDGAFALCARGGVDRFQCSLRPDPAPLYFLAPRDPACARRETRGREGFSRCAREVGLIASNACSGPIPLPLYFFGSAAAGRSLRGAVGRKGCWLIVCGRRRVVVCGWCAGGGVPWDRLRGVLLVESIQGHFQKS